MKFRVVVSVVFVIQAILVSAQFTDDFSDSDFTTNPIWSGDTNDWIISSEKLQSNSTNASASFYLSTASTLATSAQWEFLVNLQFNTSSLNFVDIFLVSDTQNLNSSLNGYFVRIGNTTDEISLYRKSGSTSSLIIDGVDKTTNTSNTTVKIKVMRDASNLWTLFRDLSGTGASYVTEGSVTDATYSTSSYFGIVVQQSTASFFNKHFFDDFYVGSIITDVIPPTISSVLVVSDTQLDVKFSENIIKVTAETANNYSASNGIGIPVSVQQDASDQTLVHLIFSTAFGIGISNTLTVSGIKDNAGNTMSSSNHPFTYFLAEIPQYGDIIFNELFTDPTPVVGLPEKEFVELYNNSNKTFDLAGWQFVNTTNSKVLPTFNLLPKEYVILCSAADTALFSSYGKVIGISSWVSLTNSSDSLTLLDDKGSIIDAIFYSDLWYNTVTKKDGGWTLELISPTNPCNGAANWTASIDPIGGTPGKQNSVFDTLPDITIPAILSVTITDSVTIEIRFSEKMDESSLLSATYQFNNGLAVVSTLPDSLLFDLVILKLNKQMNKSINYTVTVSGASDCSGNIMNQYKATLVLPDNGGMGDLVINEVLFDPRGDGADFIEIYNNSLKSIELKNWTLANISKDTIANKKIISELNFSLQSGSYIVLTKDSLNIKKEYSMSAEGLFLQMPSLPTYSNDMGVVILINDKNQVVDRFDYNDKMHFSLLNSFDGVSLERLDFNRPTNDKTNWHSASESVGFATPGYKNSQSNQDKISGSNFTIVPEVFSPDNDGFDDVVNVNYKFDSPGYVANVIIYDSRGRQIKHLVKGQLLGNEGTFSWDGISDNLEQARIGIYIIFTEVYDLDGNVKHSKIPCVVAGKI